MLVDSDINGDHMPEMMMKLEKYKVIRDQRLSRVHHQYDYHREVKLLLGKFVVATAHGPGVDFVCSHIDAYPFTFKSILDKAPFVWIDVFMDKYVDKTSRQCSPLGVYARFRVHNMGQMGGVSREFIKTLMILPRGVDHFKAMERICQDIKVHAYLLISVNNISIYIYINIYKNCNLSLFRSWRKKGFGSGMCRRAIMSVFLVHYLCYLLITNNYVLMPDMVDLLPCGIVRTVVSLLMIDWMLSMILTIINILGLSRSLIR